ncbi:MAG: DUF4159 domain-containing protein [Ignavibacteriae bacterium]|nr:DUF4159 domain-containing protein [Ignavibacteriota bacterium]
MIKILLIIIIITFAETFSQNSPFFEIARVKYSGGGDWYNDPSAEINLLKFVSEKTNIITNPVYKFVDIETTEIFSFPFLFLTGHGNIILTEKSANNLRDYLDNGGFLYVDDDYGLDKSFRRELKKVFPNNELIELPFNHEIYNSFYEFEQGPPKIHEHDNKAPKGFGLFLGKRMVIYYTAESNPSDGWANPDVHNDSPEKREEALKFGTNIIIYSLTH